MTDQVPHPMSPQDCLVAIMVAVSASDENIRTAELVKIETAVNMLPVFGGYDIDRTRRVSQIVFDLFEQEDGLDALFGLIRENLPERLNETAYALALRRGRGGWRAGRNRIATAGRNPIRAQHRPVARRRDRAWRAGAPHGLSSAAVKRAPAFDQRPLQFPRPPVPAARPFGTLALGTWDGCAVIHICRENGKGQF